MKLYTLFDTIAEESGPLFEAKNDNMARRVLETMPEESFPTGAKRSDFKLIKLGFFHHGSDKEKPYVGGLSMPQDVTHKDKVDIYEEEPPKEAA